MKTQEIVVLYHADCPDGFGASFAAWKKFGDNALYIPVHHNTPPPAQIGGKEVYLLDYAYPIEITNEVLPRVKKLIIIDHHVTAKDIVPLAHERVFDLAHSGSVLAWQYFHPDTETPLLLKYIEDVDLWKFSLPHAKELSEAIMMREFNFAAWESMLSDFENPTVLDTYIHDGSILMKRKEIIIKKILESRETVEFEGYQCLMVNSPVYSSSLGDAMVTLGSPIAIIWSRKGNRIIVSLRSKGDPDVAAIAQKYGGGGHKAAAGFSWDAKELLTFRPLSTHVGTQS